MEKERKAKIISLVALIVAVLGLTVAFAAMSETLTINGTANLDAAKWDIHFGELYCEESDRTGSMEGVCVGKPVSDGTSITGINAIIAKPGDYVGITTEIINDGTINAKVASTEISKLCTLQSPVESCDWDNDGSVTQEDIDKVNDNISFLMVGDHNYLIEEGEILKKGETKEIIVGIFYRKFIIENGQVIDEVEATELPKRDLSFKDLSVKINYVQAD